MKEYKGNSFVFVSGIGSLSSKMYI